MSVIRARKPLVPYTLCRVPTPPMRGSANGLHTSAATSSAQIVSESTSATRSVDDGVPPLAEGVPLARHVGDEHRDGVAGRDLLAPRVGGVDHEDHLVHPVAQPRLDGRGEDHRVLLVHRHHDRHRQPVVVDDRPVQDRRNPPDQPAGPAEQAEHAQGRAQHVVVQGQGHATSAPDMSRSTTESSSCPVSASIPVVDLDDRPQQRHVDADLRRRSRGSRCVSFGRQTPP